MKKHIKSKTESQIKYQATPTWTLSDRYNVEYLIEIHQRDFQEEMTNHHHYIILLVKCLNRSGTEMIFWSLSRILSSIVCMSMSLMIVTYDAPRRPASTRLDGNCGCKLNL